MDDPFPPPGPIPNVSFQGKNSVSPNVWPGGGISSRGTEDGHGYTITRLCQHVVMSVSAPKGQLVSGRGCWAGKTMAGGHFSLCLALAS